MHGVGRMQTHGIASCATPMYDRKSPKFVRRAEQTHQRLERFERLDRLEPVDS